MSKRGKKKLLFLLEIVILLIFIGGLFVYGQITSRLNKIEQPVLDEEKIEVNPEVMQAEQTTLTGYTTYALFGIDRRTKNANYAGENSDTIIIASVNNDTKEVKLVSVYRDTLLNVGNDTYSKANAAYALGGAEQAISMLNTNLDLNIRDYATIDFNALTVAVDALGGLDMPLSYAEIVHMNSYCKEVSVETGKSYTPIEELETPPEDQEAIYGTYHLNGVQVTSYCRIRYTASLDMGRTERQRRVLQMLVDKAKQAGLTSIFSLMDEVFPMVTTSLSKTDILQLIPSMIGYSMDETTGFPQNFKFADINKGSVIVPTSLISNVEELHKFLYGDDVDYTPSPTVSAYSDRIDEIVANGGEGASITETPEESVEDIWTDTSSDTSYDYSYDTDYDNSYDYSDGSTDYDNGYDYGGDTGGDYGGDTGGDYSGDDGEDYGDYGGDTGEDYSNDYSDGSDYDYSGDDSSYYEGYEDGTEE